MLSVAEEFERKAGEESRLAAEEEELRRSEEVSKTEAAVSRLVVEGLEGIPSLSLLPEPEEDAEEQNSQLK